MNERTLSLIARAIAVAIAATATLVMVWTVPGHANDLGTAPAIPEGQERSRVVGTPTLTPQQRADLAIKDAKAQATWDRMTELRAALEAGATFTASGERVDEMLAACPDGDCSWRVAIAIVQYSQERSFWCGPAMLKSLVRVRGITISQSTAAHRLSTTTNGTDWYNGSYYPVERALDHYLGPHGANYVPIALPGSPTSTQRDLYKERLYRNVSRNWGIAGDAWEVPNGPHLIGHPNTTIFHWFAIRGFHDWGERTNYADPASGAPSLTWGARVPRYSTMSSNTIVTILGGRGYVW
jgi:hypothetical protein